MGLLNGTLFYTTLGYNLLRNFLSDVDWPWYCRIDETIVLGALPFKSTMNHLVNEEKVAGVVCVAQAHEVEHSWVADKKVWEAAGVRYFWLPIQDFFFSATATSVHEAVEFIKTFENTGNSVYVHCKAGRSRSALVAMCYLMQKHKWYSPAAYALVKSKRPRIVLYHEQWKTIEDYGKQYVWSVRR